MDDDHHLLAAAGRGDRDAFARLMERHAGFALALATRVLGNADDADEIVQEAFLRVWRKAPDWRDDGTARFTTWLYRVVLNLCTDRRRRAPMLPLDAIDEPADPAPHGLDRLGVAAARRLVAEALASLPDRQREAMALCHLGEVGNREAAQVLGISVSAVESLLARGRRGLRDFFIRRGFTTLRDIL